MNNTALLTAGNAIYSQKRAKKRARLDEITFDPAKRNDYLTGFHKRKTERQKKAAEFNKEQARKDRIEARKEIREARKADIEQRLEAVNATLPGVDEGDETEGEGADDIKVPKDSIWENHFEDSEKLTAVTVIEDFDQIGLETPLDIPPPQETLPTTTEPRKTPSSTSKSKTHPEKKKKFRYGTKAERHTDRKKAKLKKEKHGEKFSRKRK